jgi:hypothetical protein
VKHRSAKAQAGTSGIGASADGSRLNENAQLAASQKLINDCGWKDGVSG